MFQIWSLYKMSFEFKFDPFFDLDCDDINIIDMFADNGFGNLLFLRSLNLI
jgi:hypothetical protein